MNATFKAFLSSWSFDAWIAVPVFAAVLIYLRGWTILHRRTPHRFSHWRLTAFVCAMALLLLALISPIDAFSSLLLQMHMIQHVLLMFLIPPLIWLSLPELPLLFGLPRTVRREWIAPLYRLAWLRNVFSKLTRPVVAWVVFVGATWIWHLPRFYEAALKSPMLHNLEHACFFWAAMLFWWPVVQPYPSRVRYSRWLLLPYLFLAALQGTVLSGILSFAGDVLYDHYASLSSVWGISALHDQAIAGSLMWIVGMIAYVTAAMFLGYHLVFASPPAGVRFAAVGIDIAAKTVPRDHSTRPRTSERQPRRHRPRAGSELPILAPESPERRRPRGRDLLRVPVVGNFLRWKHARVCLQVVMFVAAAAVIVDGLWGTQVVSLNLAGVLPWIHWRGYLVIGLLVAGNLFCMACPFKLSRTLGKRLFGGKRNWPRPLRSKWLAVALLVLFFWAYEVFSLWQSPWWTAWIAVGYFLAAFMIDGWFRGAAFCKYVCPIGQFNFVQSFVSPLEVRVKETAVCSGCTTQECIRGDTQRAIPGCELQLYQPRKSSNFDCTFCLDCLHACPHDNVGLVTTLPGSELVRDPRRSGIGQLSRRTDIAALVLILVFAAFVNAAGMVAPVVNLIDTVTERWGLTSRLPVVTAGYLLALVVVPVLLVAGAAFVGRRWSGEREPAVRVATRFSYMFVPIGCAMWLAHYGFHLFTSPGAFRAAWQRFGSDFGLWTAEATSWTCSCAGQASDWLLKTELALLDVGLLMSLFVGYRIARGHDSAIGRSVRAFLPWAAIAALLFLTGVWIVFQPMQMRGAPGL